MLSYGHIRAYTETMQPDWCWGYVETTIKDDEETFMNKVLKEEPQIIIATSYLFNQEFLIRILKRVHAVMDSVKIILGGPDFLGNNKRFLQSHPEISAVIRGDESSFHQVLENINGSWSTIPGICYLDTAQTYTDNGFASYSGELDNLPSLYQKGYFVKGKPFYQLETSRGCNGSCTFCTSALSTSVQYFSMKRIHSDLTVLKNAGADDIRIVDRTFNADKKRAIAMIQMFRTDFPEMKFHLEVNPAMLSPELLNEMKKTPKNQLHVEIGVQTFDATGLKTINRPATAPKQLAGMKELLALNNFEIHADLIAGLPGQSYLNTLHDVETMISAGPHEVQLENLKMLPGTPLTDSAPLSMKWNPLPPYEVLKTDTMSVSDLQRARYLSKMLDSYLNIPELRSCFIFAFNSVSNFINDFLGYIIENSDPLQKFSLKKRFDLFMSYAHHHNANLYNLLCFTWFANGFSPEKFDIKVRKVHPDMPTGKNVWKSELSQQGKRYFIFEFNFNAAAIWLDPTSSINETVHTYIFEMIHGHSLSKIEELAYPLDK